MKLEKTNVWNNDKNFRGSIEQRKTFWDQGNLILTP